VKPGNLISKRAHTLLCIIFFLFFFTEQHQQTQ